MADDRSLNIESAEKRTSPDALVKENLRLVHACEKRFLERGVEREELFSAGCLGLVKAANAFDESRGFRFSTYAVPVILGEMKALFRDGTTLRVSRSLRALKQKAEQLSEDYRKTHGVSIRLSQLSKRLGADEAQLSLALNLNLGVLSLSPDEDGNAPDVPVESEEERITDRLALKDALLSLDEHERELIRLRYFHSKTQQQTAELLNTTQVSVSRKEKKILQKLRTLLL